MISNLSQLSISLALILGSFLGNSVSSTAVNTLTPDVEDKVEVELITAEELKTKVSRNVPITIIDVRATDSYADSSEKIKGAIHVKLRRLKARLNYPPLKDVPRDQEVVTYCSCPSEESSISAAKILLQSGFKRVRALKGGWQEWLKTNGQIEAKPKGI